MPFIASFGGAFGYGRPTIVSSPPPPPSGLVTNGLIIQLDAFNVASYPGTGTTITDITGGYTHTLSNSATYTSLYGVKTFDCTTGNETIVVNGTGPTLPTSGYTYVTWARIITSSTNWRTLLRTLPNDHPILVQIGTDNLGFFDNDTDTFIDSGYAITPIKDLWVQYTVVGDSTSSIFYINGTQVGTVGSVAGGNRHWSWAGISGQPFGYTANLFYYNRKLSLAEITQNYNFLVPRFPNIVTTGLQVNVQAGNASSYPGSGAIWTNLVDNATYTITSGAYNSANGGSIVFNGTSTVVPIGTPFSSGDPDYTFEAWVFASSVASTHNIISSPLNRLYVSNGTLYADASGNMISSANFPTNVWKHVVWSYGISNNNATLYINGTQVAQLVDLIGGDAYEPLLIGAVDIENSPGDFWNGRIAQARIYNTALSAADVLANFNATKGGYLVTTTNLALYYDQTDTASYPGTGSTVTSLVGSGVNGTMTAITYTSPYFTFNGSTSQISVPDSAALEPGGDDWTVEMWINYSVIAGRTRTYLSKTDNGGTARNWGYGFRTNPVTSVTYLEVGNGTTSINSPSTSVTTNTWYQIVGVWTNVASNSIALYKNGILVGSNSHSFASIKSTVNPLYIGNYNGNEGGLYQQQFAGNIGIVRIYRQALTAAEVQNNYDANKALYGL